MKKSKLIKKLEEIPGDPEVVLMWNQDAYESVEKVTAVPGIELADGFDVKTQKAALEPVAVLSGVDYESETVGMSESDLRKEYAIDDLPKE